MRRAAKRDANEKAIVAALEAAGWHVHRCSDEGLPDLLVTKDGVQRWLEVKTPKGTLRTAQSELWGEWDERWIRVIVIESPQEALDVVNCVHTGKKRWRDYPVDKRGRGAKKAKRKRWVPQRSYEGKTLGHAFHAKMMREPK